MSLSEQELRALQEIEQSLMAEDPKFGSSVSEGIAFAGNGGGVTLRGIALIVVGLVMMVGGVALAQQSLWFVILSIAGFLVMFGAGVWMLRGGSGGSASPLQGSSRTVRSSGAKKENGMGSRLEDNFRKRFENDQ